MDTDSSADDSSSPYASSNSDDSNSSYSSNSYDDNELDSCFYYKFEEIIKQIETEYALPKRFKKEETKEFLKILVALGWRHGYLKTKFQNMHDDLLQNWPDNLLIDMLFKHFIQEQGYLDSIQSSFVALGLREDVASKLQTILTPLLDSTYTNTQVLDRGIDYLLGRYDPIAYHDTPHYIKPDTLHTWFNYRHSDTAKPIQVYNVDYIPKYSQQDFESAIQTLSIHTKDTMYYYHPTSWKDSFYMIKYIDCRIGVPNLDFGIHAGFYLSNNHLHAIDWAIRNTKCWNHEVATLIFAIPNTLPEYIKCKELKDDEWVQVTTRSRKCKEDMEIINIRNYDMLYGNIVSNPEKVKNADETPVPHNPPIKQMVGKNNVASDFLRACLVGCVYFRKDVVE